MDLCKYKDMFGKPNEGVHSIRFFGFAFIDLFMTFIASFIFSYLMIKMLKINLSWIYYFIILMILAIFMHKLFCVETALNKLIFV